MNSLLFIITFIIFALTESWMVFRLAKQHNRLYMKTILTAFLLTFLYVLADLIFEIGVPKLILLLVLISVFIQTYFGYYKDFFMRSKTFDRYLHAFGTFSYALFFYSLIDIILHPDVKPKVYASIFVFALGMTVGAIFEIIEFTLDKIFHTKMQKNLKDTDFDMVFDGIGSLFAAVISHFFIL